MITGTYECPPIYVEADSEEEAVRIAGDSENIITRSPIDRTYQDDPDKWLVSPADQFEISRQHFITAESEGVDL